MCKPYEWSSLKALDNVSAWWNLTGVLPSRFSMYAMMPSIETTPGGLCGSSVSGFQVIPAGDTRFCWHLPRSHRHRGTCLTWLTLPRPTGSRCRWSCEHQECRWWLCQVKAHKKPCLRNRFLREEWLSQIYVYFAICQIFFIWVFSSTKISEFPDICKHWIIYCYPMTCFLVKLQVC